MRRSGDGDHPLPRQGCLGVSRTRPGRNTRIDREIARKSQGRSWSIVRVTNRGELARLRLTNSPLAPPRPAAGGENDQTAHQHQGARPLYLRPKGPTLCFNAAGYERRRDASPGRGWPPSPDRPISRAAPGCQARPDRAGEARRAKPDRPARPVDALLALTATSPKPGHRETKGPAATN